MFCPQCGSNQSDELKFCKSCGTNLGSVREAVATRDEGEKFDWNKTWIAEMLMSSEESVKRAAELERIQGLTPDAKRRNEIKGGVITGSVGIGLMILLFVLMEGIIASGRVSDTAAAILSRLWVVGVIPIFVGIALVINGMFVSKRSEEPAVHETDAEPKQLSDDAGNVYLPPADTNQLGSIPFSVTDETTRRLLKESSEKRQP